MVGSDVFPTESSSLFRGRIRSFSGVFFFTIHFGMATHFIQWSEAKASRPRPQLQGAGRCRFFIQLLLCHMILLGISWDFLGIFGAPKFGGFQPLNPWESLREPPQSLTSSPPENRPSEKERIVFLCHHFSGASC